MNRLLPATLLLLMFFGPPAFAAPPSEKPTMNPELSSESPGETKDPLGVKGLTKDRPKDAKTEITSKKQATFDNAKNVAEFEGSVVVKDPQFTLFCDQLRVTMSKDRKGLQLVEAFGNVIIVQDNTDEAGKKVKSTGRSGKAVFEPVSGDVTLTDMALSPARYQHASRHRAGNGDDFEPRREDDDKGRKPNSDRRQ